MIQLGRSALFIFALCLIQGLAVVQSARYFDGFITFANIPGLLYLVAALVGIAIGWTTQEMRLLFLFPFIVITGAAVIFIAVASSPIWLSGIVSSGSIITELVRQSLIISFLSLAPLYVGGIAGMLLKEARR